MLRHLHVSESVRQVLNRTSHSRFYQKEIARVKRVFACAAVTSGPLGVPAGLSFRTWCRRWVSARDSEGNAAERTIEVIYDPEYDPSGDVPTDPEGPPETNCLRMALINLTGGLALLVVAVRIFGAKRRTK